MKETDGVSKSQTYGAMKKGTCLICGEDISKLSWKKQTEHAEACQKKHEEEKKQQRLF